MWPLSLVILNVRKAGWGGYLDSTGHNTLHGAGLLVYFPLISTREGELLSLWLTCCGVIRQQPEPELMLLFFFLFLLLLMSTRRQHQTHQYKLPQLLLPPCRHCHRRRSPFTSLVINGLCQSSWVIGRTSSPVKRLISTLLCGWLKAAINNVMGSAWRFVFPPAACRHQWRSVIRVRWLYLLSVMRFSSNVSPPCDTEMCWKDLQSCLSLLAVKNVFYS